MRLDLGGQTDCMLQPSAAWNEGAQGRRYALEESEHD
jgi:hypothetical protein